MRFRVAIALLAACASAPLIAQAGAPQAAASQPLPSSAAADIVRDVIKVVRENYVFPERADAIVHRLEASLASGRYSTASPATLAERMSADLKESSGNDGHMYINYNPSEAAARRTSKGAPDPEFFRQQMASVNHGITELKVLPGNVRYMNISQWYWDPDGVTKKIYDDAMAFLRGGDAIIIDVRDNGGGAAQPVQYVASHFLDPGQKLITFRSGPTEVEEISSQRIAAGKISGKPLMLLVGPRSASASEEFAAHIKNFNIGTLIGQTTAGAGNPNGLFPVAHGFVVSVSTGTATHPVTDRGWEGEGISPHRKVDLSRALDVAHAEALKAALPSAPAQRRASLQWMIDALSADNGPAPLTPAQLRSFTGSYEGDRRITECGGRLYWKREGGPEFELIPLGGNRFAIGDKFGTRVEFSGAEGLTMLRPNAAPERVARLGA